jgi:alkylhydroperoxidase/carboxymuconolactone decarboxylase family protein YurZ
VHPNDGQVALEMGNSLKVIEDHFFEIVDERATGECWSIKQLPKGDRKIVAISSSRSFTRIALPAKMRSA